MSSIGVLLCRGGEALRDAGIADARREARLLLAYALGCRVEDLLRDPRAAVPDGARAAFEAALARRAAHEPLAHIAGHQGFWSLDLAVSPATLIPRADSETLIEAALECFPDRAAVRMILDLGTGTGALLLAALAEFRGARGVGVDLVPAAAALAAGNARRNGLAGRAGFIVGHWAAPVSARFELVLCNPPYIPRDSIAVLMPEVARHEPATALDGGADGLDGYRAVLAALPDVLAPAGRAILELGQGQRDAVEALARDAGLRPIGCRADLGGIERALVLARGQGCA